MSHRFVFRIFVAASLALGFSVSRVQAALRYQPVDGVKGFTVGYTKVINLHAETGVVSPYFDDILITHLSFRLSPHDPLPLTLLAYAWQDDGSAVQVGHLSAGQVAYALVPDSGGKVMWLSGANHTCRWWRSNDLDNWQRHGTPMEGTGFRQEIHLKDIAAPVFFRLEMSDKP